MAPLLGDEADVALVAVGGYGRRELCPGSDLDLVLVHAGRRDIGEVADRIWYPIWDSGVRLDHSVRTVKEALDVAETDLKVMLGLQTARLVAGDAGLATRLRDEANDRWRNGARKWLAVLRDHVATRHERFGEVAFLLEPDVKEGRGGLRDVHAVALARAASPVVAEPTAGVEAAYDILLTVRVELHRRTGRADDRLLLELQDDVAAALQLDADQLMGRVAEAARTIAWYGDD
ncbi:MAG: [protein-PII] uridylyltransferase, partial [Actinobacteria bacterium]|nr:[protein-PII] uridylyltransferase [Actinomycetota bacterium]